MAQRPAINFRHALGLGLFLGLVGVSIALASDDTTAKDAPPKGPSGGAIVPLAPTPAPAPAPKPRLALDATVPVGDEITVYDDLFARWDDTRWHIETEVVLPYVMRLGLEDNLQVEVMAFQTRAVIACSKEWRISGRKYEVDCRIEEVGLQLVPRHRRDFVKDDRKEDIASIIAGLDDKLTGAKLTLQVTDDGRVVNINLDDVQMDKRNRRTSLLQEAMRQILARVMVGFDMRLRKGTALNEGKWVEYNTAMMSMPDVLATQGSSKVVHQLNYHDGLAFVQTLGRGLVVGSGGVIGIQTGDGASVGESGGGSMADAGADSELRQSGVPDGPFIMELQGVSVFDPKAGFMLERVWVLEGKSTSSAGLAREYRYWHAGRITMIDKDAKPDVGPSHQVSPQGMPLVGFPMWLPVR